MLLSVMKYSAVITKIKGMYSKLLSTENYTELMNKKNVNGIVSWLKLSAGYGHTLEKVNEYTIHRGEFERLFVRALLDDCKRIYRLLGNNEKLLLKALMTRFEYDSLKTIIRSFQTHTSPPNIFYEDLRVNNIGFGTGIDLWKCAEAKSLHELAEILKETKYYTIFKPFVVGDREYTDINIEMSLDNDYLLGTMDALSKLLSGDQKKGAEDFWGQEIDIMNILWIYRCKKYYNNTKEEILVHIVPYRYKISKEFISNLASSDIKEFKSIMLQTKYGKIFDNDDDRIWEQNLRIFLYKLYKHHLRSDTYNFASIMAYVYLKEVDIKNIITITEGVRYNLEPLEIKKLLTTNMIWGI